MAGTIFKKDVSYKTNRYEEWQAGRCINQGEIKLIINSRMDGEKIIFSIAGTHQLYIPNEFDFNIFESCILNDGRIQYVKAHGSTINSQIPIVCHLFIEQSKIQYIRFAMTNPDRIIEFYGTHINNNQNDDEKDYKLTFLSSAINLASCDGDISEKEMELIYAIMQREGLNENDFEHVVLRSNTIKNKVPQDISWRAQHLRDIVALAMVDGIFHDSEYDLCKTIARGNGFDPSVIDLIRKENNEKMGTNI